ncbi:MAG: hypothetical protein J2P47_10800, partial [Acetobacteraceae bacterium]|nr:hypothetical protein [Acetobacteraceae bacterium]
LTPLFPGYCFTRIELQWHDVRRCPGVMRLVRIGGDEPVHVPDQVIDAIRKRERNGVDPPKKRGIKTGDRVHIISGALSGRFGLYAGMASRERAMILLRLLGADRRVKLAQDAIEPV